MSLVNHGYHSAEVLYCISHYEGTVHSIQVQCCTSTSPGWTSGEEISRFEIFITRHQDLTWSSTMGLLQSSVPMEEGCTSSSPSLSLTSPPQNIAINHPRGSNMSTRSRALQLYRSFFRESRNFADYNLRSYIVRRVREDFRSSANAPSERVEELLARGEEELTVVRRQAMVSSIFSGGVRENVVTSLN